MPKTSAAEEVDGTIAEVHEACGTLEELFPPLVGAALGPAAMHHLYVMRSALRSLEELRDLSRRACGT